MDRTNGTPVTSGHSFTLTQGDLRVTVLTPWSEQYCRTRFTHAAFLSEVWYGDVCYTAAEATTDGQRKNCGMGLCCEYKCPDLDRDIPVGQDWLKPGVGVIRRETEPWHFKSECTALKTPVTVVTTQSTAHFESASPMVNGFGYREKRTVEVLDHSIQLTVEFTNTGEKDWDMAEYCHNFISMDGSGVDEHLHLLMPSAVKAAEATDGHGTIETWNGLNWTCIPTQWFLYRYPNTRNAAFNWLLYRDNSPLSISERVSEQPSLMQVWGDDHCIAPETFVRVHVKPGQSKTWMREWLFAK